MGKYSKPYGLVSVMVATQREGAMFGFGGRSQLEQRMFGSG
jgi:hypothetical protein